VRTELYDFSAFRPVCQRSTALARESATSFYLLLLLFLNPRKNSRGWLKNYEWLSDRWCNNQSVQSTVGKESCNKTTLKRCSSTECTIITQQAFMAALPGRDQRVGDLSQFLTSCKTYHTHTHSFHTVTDSVKQQPIVSGWGIGFWPANWGFISLNAKDKVPQSLP